MDLTNTRQTIDAPPESQLIRQLSGPLFRAKGWLKLLGVLSIIYGALTVFSGWGILIAWLPVWMGILLFKAGSAAAEAQARGDKAQLMRSLDRLRTFFTIQGIMLLVGLVLMAVMLLVFGGAMFSMFSQMQQMPVSPEMMP